MNESASPPPPRWPEQMMIADRGEEIALGCTCAGAEVRAGQEPTADLLNAVQVFAAEHAACL